jgi:hypothetical protein
MKKRYRKLKQLKEFAKDFLENETLKKHDRKNMLKTKDGISNITNGACIRPDIFLNNDRCCEGCSYFDNCNCDIKTLEIGKRRYRK